MRVIDFHNIMPQQAVGEIDRLLVIASKNKNPFKVRLITGHGITRDLVQGYLLMNDLTWQYDGVNDGAMLVYLNEEE